MKNNIIRDFDFNIICLFSFRYFFNHYSIGTGFYTIYNTYSKELLLLHWWNMILC